jgi:serine phosphatase RsbU (regulator of sigma subunit)
VPVPSSSLPPASRAVLVRHWLTRTVSGRAILFGVVVKVFAFIMTIAAGASWWSDLIDTVGDLALIAGAVILAYRLFVELKQRVLWRVSRKLTVSYIFIGLVPALLIIVFFLVGGMLLFLNIAAYLMEAQIAQLVDQTRFVAESTAIGIQRARGTDDIRETLQARLATLASRYPRVSIALVPSAKSCGTGVSPPAPIPPMVVGAWSHTAPPADVPDWIGCDGYAGVLTYVERGRERAAARAALWPPGTSDVVIVDVPIDDAFAHRVGDRIKAVIAGLAVFDVGEVDPVDDNPDPDVRAPRPVTLETSEASSAAPGGRLWIALHEFRRWTDGSKQVLVVNFRMALRDIYDQIAIPSGLPGRLTFGQLLLIMLAVVGGLFLIIQAVAFSMGLALARSITGSVHELFAGTERVRRGDFTGRVGIRSRDQLGDLAQSFNSMTSSIEDLLQQKAEKERLEQELRIARNIQMSLLPQGPLAMPGLTLTAHCEPAREVGGDYYDFLPIDDHTLGILVADVSGKGTSAALYMAELKGIVLSLSQRHRSPRELLIEADHIISRHLDSRSFITVTYLVVDLRAGTLHYARAGHCPLVYVPGPYAPERAPQLMAPDGLVLGLQLDEGRTFVRLLEEVTLPIGRGDLFVLYTDGLSEAMNADGDCFGDNRLATLIGEHADLGGDELRERILREIDAFTNSAVQQDDMTMVVLRVEQVGQASATAALAHADA